MRSSTRTENIYYTLMKKSFMVLTITILFSYSLVLEADSLLDKDRIEVPGYTLKRVRRIPLRNSIVYQWTHDKTGAEIVFVKNNDQHRYFSIGFRTYAEDDTGVLHVLEHTIMQGSKKYPVEFRRLGNLNINNHFSASTSWSKTVYEFSSNNSEASFINQSNVLCDYIFDPLVLENPYIFYQEGVRREFEDGKLKYNGTVFNEVMGTRHVWRFKIYNFFNKIFKDSNIRYEHGGVPTKVPNLTYKKLIEAYHKFYYPSNSLLYFYGDVDIQERLQSIDQNYLSRYQWRSPVVFPNITPVNPGDKLGIQKVPSSRELLNDLRLNRVFVPTSSLDDFSVRFILPELFDNDSSLIKTELLSSKLFQHYYPSVVHLPSSYTWINLNFVLNRGKNPDTSVTQIEDLLKDLLQRRIDPSIIRSLLMKQKYAEKTLHTNDGDNLKDEIYTGWIDYADPFQRLGDSSHLDTLLSYTDKELSDYIGYLLGRYVLNADVKYNEVIVYDTEYYKEYTRKVPRKAYDEQRRASPEKIQELQQIEHDTKEFISKRARSLDLDKIPSIGSKDLKNITNTNVSFLPTIVQGDRGKYLAYDTSEDEISHLVLYFDISTLTEEEIMLLSLINTLLENEISSNFRALYSREDKDFFLFAVKIKFLPQHQKEKILKAHDSLYLKSFSDIGYILQVIKKNITNYNSHRLNGSHIESFYSQQDYFTSLVSGINYVKFLKILVFKIYNDSNFSIVDSLKGVLNKVLTSTQVSVGIASNPKELPSIIKDFETVFDDISSGTHQFGTRSFNLGTAKNVGITSPQNIYQILRSIPLKIGEHSPLASVIQAIPLERYLLSNYLFPRIGYEGGAYLVTALTTQDKVLKIYSKDDPNALRTLKIIHELPSFMEHTTVTDSATLMAKIDTTSDIFPPMSPFARAQSAWYRFFYGISETDFKNKVDTMFETDLSKLVKDCAAMFSEVVDSGSTTIVGNKKSLERLKDQGFLDEIIK